MKKIELLAPAGDMDALRAAVENGADAVYLGGRLFNARQSAGNFEPEQLKAAVEYAHVRGVKIYLTMNTLIADEELEEALRFAGEAYSAGVDSMIVQDAGLAALLRKALPSLPLHGSTQMTITDGNGAKQLEELGFSRVVLARELPAEEIRDIVRNTSLEVEMFVHGALCICYSGQCLMSSIIGGRSGNRGKCAQPCRLPYELVKQQGRMEKDGRSYRDNRTNEAPGYLLSPKDLCLLGNLSEIVELGVKSLKIEGRMKSPEYVAAVVGTYRKYLDRVIGVDGQPGETAAGRAKSQDQSGSAGIEPGDLHDLMQVFNRGGFSEGYFHGKTGRDMMCFEKPKNWGIYLGKVLSYNAAAGLVKIRLEEDLAVGDGIEIWNGENESPGTVVSQLRGPGGFQPSAPAGSVIEVGLVRGRIPKDCPVYKTSDKALNARLTESWNGRQRRKVPLDATVSVRWGEPLRLEAQDPEGNQAWAEGTVLPEKALNRALSRERLEEQLNKTGNTPFRFNRLELELEDGLSLPVSEINEVRRKVLEDIETARAAASRVEFFGTAEEQTFKKVCDSLRTLTSRHSSSNKKSSAEISLFMHQWNKDLDYAVLGADRIYLPLSSVLEPSGEGLIKECKAAGMEVIIQLSAVTRGPVLSLLGKAAANAAEWGADGFLAGNIGAVHLLKELKEQSRFRLYGDIGLNILNAYTAAEYERMGLAGVILSPELTLKQIAAMHKPASLQVEAAVYGRLPLMTSEYCPVGVKEGGHTGKRSCSRCCGKAEYSLRDRKGMEFPVVCDPISCRSQILNANVLFIPDTLRELTRSGVDSLRLYIREESPEQVQQLVALHREMAADPSGSSAKFGKLISTIKDRGFTKGHYFRGV